MNKYVSTLSPNSIMNQKSPGQLGVVVKAPGID
jgi:hypothetical protein